MRTRAGEPELTERELPRGPQKADRRQPRAAGPYFLTRSGRGRPPRGKAASWRHGAQPGSAPLASRRQAAPAPAPARDGRGGRAPPCPGRRRPHVAAREPWPEARGSWSADRYRGEPAGAVRVWLGLALLQVRPVPLQVRKAVEALLAFSRSKAKGDALLLNESDSLHLLVTVWKIPRVAQIIKM